MAKKKELLDAALEAQFRDVDTGTDGQKKKESVESLKILYELSMAQDKADTETEFKESEMQLKEREMALKEAEQKAKEKQLEDDAELKKTELAIKERELAIKKSDSLSRKIELGLGFGGLLSGLYGQHLYKKNFNTIYKLETETLYVPVAQRAAGYLKNIERLAIQGIGIVIKKH